ncbi:LacI family DNA-binding transcriptional regulator [Paenalkalicoccus suaedae]|uniref:LacI family DNA-binding transcriptional regulator n=1 Tax=Paenalkalicoccus suaedae TaxID=2592382 RepID=A0A859FB64_9BACI|nr:LacI family DNA-binding transcriptional regulator [Paenalkalicoccus suaedae]QKS70509.1 LacI family DNA-binding transcriptional regulator [Paenalkalicoccus suaedae]
MTKDISITEVAKRAGVSIATVSRVFHNRGPVKESTRRKIESIIEETGYTPNQLARELANKKTQLIGLIVHDFTGEGLPRAINGVNQIVEDQGYHVLMTSTRGNLDSELRNFEILRSKRVEGIIFATRSFKKEHQEIIEKLPIPVVVMLQDTTENGISSVFFQNKQFAYDATKALLGMNHRQLAFFGGPSASVNSSHRKDGFIQAFMEAGMTPDDKMVKHGDFSIESGYIQMNKLLALKKPFTALVTINDAVAIGAINCLLDHGMRIPEDVSIIALDKTVVADASRVQLSAVSYSYQDLGIQAAKLLVKQIGSGNKTIEQIKIDYDVHLQDSTQRLNVKE